MRAGFLSGIRDRRRACTRELRLCRDVLCAKAVVVASGRQQFIKLVSVRLWFPRGADNIFPFTDQTNEHCLTLHGHRQLWRLM